MELQIKHLSAYLPYEVKFVDRKNTNERILMGLPYIFDEPHAESVSKEGFPISSIQLLLRPLSQLTELIEHNGKRVVPLNDLEEYAPADAISEFVGHMRDFDFKPHEINMECCPKWVLEQLYEWHFDTEGLIESGLAKPIESIKTE